MIKRSVILLLDIFFCITAYEIKLQDDGPIVKGGTIQFLVEVFNGNNLATDHLKYEWHDDGIPQHKMTEITENGVSKWEVTYNTVYPAGAYIAEVVVYKSTWYGTWYEVISARIEFDVTVNLNGNLVIEQRNKTISNGFVSTKEEVIHVIDLKKTDMNFIKTAPVVRTFWFIDCIYYGITQELRFPFNYTTPGEDHLVEALVMADFTPLPPTTTVPPSTTTVPTTASPNTTTTTTTIKPTTITTMVPTTKKIVKRETKASAQFPQSNIKVWNNGSLVPYNVSVPYVCNSTYISTDPEKSYGYFFKKFSAKDPISNINVTGNNWIQPGDLLSLRIRCKGSKSFRYCIQSKKGEYNITGNETCIIYQQLDTCDFNIRRYLTYPKNTIVIIIENDVSKEVTPVTVNIYKVKKQGQLSVIVVPVAFSLVAVVLIVFGVAYYFQNRSRFIIEVADFNFGQQYTDMEYKTFRERLRDSISNAFTRTPTPSSSEVPVWPPGRKYGSMT